MKCYANRDPMELDRKGGYYARHVEHLTSEKLHWKSDIAAELGHRDMQIDLLRKALAGLIGVETKADLEQMEAAMRFVPAPDADKAVSINAIHALLATMPEGA